jgi:hypothetical protein
VYTVPTNERYHVAFTKNIISPTLENQMMIKQEELTPFSASNASLCGADRLATLVGAGLQLILNLMMLNSNKSLGLLTDGNFKSINTMLSRINHLKHSGKRSTTCFNIR